MIQAFGGDKFGHGKNTSVTCTHDVVDLSESTFNSRPDNAKIANDPGVFIGFQPLINIYFGRFVFVFKYMPIDADKIGNHGYNFIGAVFIRDSFEGGFFSFRMCGAHIRLLS